MKTSTAKANGYRCPKCGDETTRDGAGLGYVRHTRNPNCEFEKGERDEFVPPAGTEAQPTKNPSPLPVAESQWQSILAWVGKHVAQTVVSVIIAVLTAVALAWLGLSK